MFSLFLGLVLTLSANGLLPASPANIDHTPGVVAYSFADGAKCTAVKIAPKTFLTAAHCFEYTEARRGTPVSLLQIENSGRSAKLATRFTSIKVHPIYGKSNFLNLFADASIDLAVFKTESDFARTQKLSFASPREGEAILIGGYGTQGSGCNAVGTNIICPLNLANQRIYDTSNSEFTAWPTEKFPAYLTLFDSGGPVFALDPQSKGIVVIGINKEGSGNYFGTTARGEIFQPKPSKSVFQRIDNQIEWIVRAAK